MTVFFYAVPALIALGALGIAYGSVRRTVQMRLAWRGGLTAEARCLRAYATASSHGDGHSSRSLHHVYEYAAADGRPVRFEERGGPATTVEGDVVVVHYRAERPEQATAFPPGYGRSTVGVLATLVFTGFVVAFSVAFAVSFPG